MNVIERPYTHFSVIPRRPIVGLILHDTEGTSDLTTAQSAGSWHYLIGRQGTVYRDVPEPYAAWHVAACDEWYPPWMRQTPAKYQPLSDANYCTIGIELVSHKQYRDAGVPYTEAQYRALAELLADITRWRGQLPIVGHGQLQLDRTDPVAFDYTRAGLRWDATANGYLPIPAPVLPVAPTPPVEAPTMLTDSQAENVAMQLWDQRQQLFTPGFAIADAWLREWRAGRYRGLPQGPELDGPDGTKVQSFDLGAAVWVPASGVSWQA